MNRITQKWIANFLLAITIFLWGNFMVKAQQNPLVNSSSNSQCLLDSSLKLKVKDVAPKNNSDSNIKMGNTIIVTVSKINGEELDLDAAKNEGLITPNNLILYLNNYALDGLYGKLNSKDQLRFKLLRTDESQEAWNDILGGSIKQSRNVKISIGCPGGIAIPSDVEQEIYLNTGISTFFLILFAVLLFLFLRKFRDSIRDDSQMPSFSYEVSEEYKIDYQPRNTSSLANLFIGQRFRNKPPFSLGRTQMAWWFFIVIGSFLFIFALTGDFTNIINSQALILIGISAGTGIGAVFIDDGKKSLSSEQIERIENLQAEIQALKSQHTGLSKVDIQEIKNIDREIEKKQKNIRAIIPCSSGFIKDLLTTENGVSFYRYQIFVWTIILGIIFLIKVINHLDFPEFDSTLLTLQGISSGTYLGFKLPEKSKSSDNLNS